MTIFIFQRFCCECGKFNLCEFIWYAHCIFHLIWATLGLLWLSGMGIEYKKYNSYPDYEAPDKVWNTVLASIILDYVLAGSEIVHRIKLHMERNKTSTEGDMEMGEQGQMINNASSSHKYTQ